MDTCFFKNTNLRWPPPAEQNTYGLIFVKQHYESLKATTSRGAKHLRSQVYVYGNDREAKPLRPETIDNQAKGIFEKPSLHFCMISNRWLWLLEALSNCPLRSKRFRRRKMSILEKPKLHLFDETTCGETTLWNDIALWIFQNGHLLAQGYCDTPCMSNNAPPSKTAPVKK